MSLSSTASSARAIEATGYEQACATTFTDSTTMSGGRRTLGSCDLLASAFTGSCTGPITSTFLFTFAVQSDCDDPPSTYVVADAPCAFVRMNTVPPSVVFAC